MKNGQLQARDFYRSVIKESPVGYSYHKIIRDGEGDPVDYEFLEINQAFQDLIGLDRSKIIGSRGTEIFPGLREGEVDWVEEYGRLAETGEDGEFREFEQFSKERNLWFRVKAYSPRRDYLVTYYTDVTQEMELARASEFLLQRPPGEIDYQALTDRALDISGAKYVYFNLFEEGGKSFTTKAVSGPSEDIQNAASLLGIDLVGKTWDPDPERWEKMMGQSIIHFDSITELTKNLLPNSIIKGLERAFSVGETVLARIQKEDRMVGDFTFIMPRDKDLKRERLIEIYTKQVGSLIVRQRAEKRRRESERELKKSKKRYQNYFEQLGDAIFLLQMGGEDHGKILEVNPSAVRQTGYSRDELIGMNLLTELSIEGTADIDFDRANEKLDSGEVVNFTEKKERKDGTEYWTEVVTTPTEHKGAQANISINRDVTERIQAQKNLKEERMKLRQLHDAVDELQRQETEEEILRTAVGVIQNMLDFQLSVIYILEGDKLIPKATSSGLAPDETATHEVGEGLTGKTVQSGETTWGDDIRDYPEAKPTKEDFRAFISAPIGDMGVFQVISEEVGSISERDVELVEILADHLREELNRVRLEEDLRKQALRDPLTGLYNRRYFNEILEKESEKAKRYNESMTFLMLDVNRFKEVNDRYSHQTGDEVLKEVAGLLKDHVRSADTVVRYGGDEFLIMMPKTGEEVTNTVNRLNGELERWNEENDLLDFPLSLAMGVSYWSPDQDRDVEKALKEADEKMYEDKRR